MAPLSQKANARVLINLVEAHLKAGAPHLAEQELGGIERLAQTENPDELLLWGRVRLAQHDFAGAKEIFQRVSTERNPNVVEILRAISEAWLAAERYQDATAVLEDIASRTGSSADLQKLGRAFIRASLPQEAIPVLQRAITIEPTATRYGLLGSAHLGPEPG